MLGVLLFLGGLCVSVAEGKGTESGSKPGRDWMFYVEEDSGRMVSVATNTLKNTLVDCYVSGDRSLITAVMQTVPKPNITIVDKPTLEQLAGICTYAKQNGHLSEEDGEDVSQKFGIFSGFFIYPGTKWCGAGNVSNDYEDLGQEVEADECCRDHDHCEDHIAGYESKHGLDNNSPFTKSHCDCDTQFYDCLRVANTRASNRVGKIFFNYIQMECFREDHPTTGCKRYKGWFRRRCQEYDYDLSRDPMWQMFDAQHYEVEPDEDNEVEDEYKGDVFEYMLRMVDIEEKFMALNNKDPK